VADVYLDEPVAEEHLRPYWWVSYQHRLHWPGISSRNASFPLTILLPPRFGLLLLRIGFISAERSKLGNRRLIGERNVMAVEHGT